MLIGSYDIDWCYIVYKQNVALALFQNWVKILLVIIKLKSLEVNYSFFVKDCPRSRLRFDHDVGLARNPIIMESFCLVFDSFELLVRK